MELKRQVQEGGGFLADILLQLETQQTTHFLSWNDVPECWKTNPCVASAAIQKALVSSWHELPWNLQNSMEFAQSVQRFPTAIFAEQLLARFEPLRSKWMVWDSILCSVKEFQWKPYYNNSEHDGLHGIMAKYAPVILRSDANFMKKACMIEAGVLRLLDESLATTFEQNGVFLEIVGQNPEAVKFLSPAVKLRQPEIVNLALQRFKEEVDSHDHDISRFSIADSAAFCFGEELWSDESFVKQWFKHGFPFCFHIYSIDDDDFGLPDSLINEEIIVLIAKHSHPSFLKATFEDALRCLESSQRPEPPIPSRSTLILQALEAEPELSLLEFAGEGLQNDFDLCLAAFSGKESAARDEVRHRARNDLDFIVSFRSELQRRLEVHNIIIGTLLLTDLNQGTETSKAHLNAILGFLDAPTIGKQVRMHHRAISNLDAALPDHNNDE